MSATLSPRKLREQAGINLPEEIHEKLAERYPTEEQWRKADKAQVERIIGDPKRAKQVLQAMKD